MDKAEGDGNSQDQRGKDVFSDFLEQSGHWMTLRLLRIQFQAFLLKLGRKDGSKVSLVWDKKTEFSHRCMGWPRKD
jgi:hypothetical protein